MKASWKNMGFIPEFKSPQQEQEDWQFRIKVAVEDLERAAEILKNYLNDYEWKYYRFDGFDSDSGKVKALDGTYNGADRDQRFKTVCVYIKPKQENAEDHVEALKAILLTCWKEMEKADISLNYQTALGDKPICVKTDDGDAPTPFSYTASKPYNQRHKILNETNYNPHQFADPLDGLSFSFDDLDDYHINYHPLLTSVELLCETEKHALGAHRNIQQELDDSLNNSEKNSISTHYIEEIIASIKVKYAKYQAEMGEAEPEKQKKELKKMFKGFIEGIKKDAICRFPRDACSENLAWHKDLVILDEKRFLEATLTSENVNELLDRVKVDSMQELEAIKSDYAAANSINESSIFSAQNKDKVSKLIEMNPAKAQELYRRQMHLQYEVRECLKLREFVGKRCNSVLLPKSIKNEIDRLTKASWNPFKRGALIERKREALELLRDEFAKKENKGKTISAIIDSWLATESFKYNNVNLSNQDLISRRSNSFFAKKITPASAGETQEKTDTLQFIERLKQNYGRFKI